LSAGRPLKMYSSSPRRAYNLGAFFKWALPFTPVIEFCSVRGNITTRLEKLMSDDVQGLVVAKAALDRLLAAKEPEFQSAQKTIRATLGQCRFMILPLSASPAAPAQGALAVEILRSRDDVRALVKTVNCEETMNEVLRERREFKKYGGGCHQKIGITCLAKDWGMIEYGRGETVEGEAFSYTRVTPDEKPVATVKKQSLVRREQMFPVEKGENSFFRREVLAPTKFSLGHHDLWVARAEAWPEGFTSDERLVWVSGLETWKKLAAQGIWVNGTSDSLGEREATGLETILGRTTDFVKLTHIDAASLPSTLKSIGTYRLVPNEKSAPDLQGKTHFYWLSYTSFMRALEIRPEVIAGCHSCGPGQTYELIKAELARRLPNETPRLEIYISRESWLKEVASKD
jgi:hydroxymethylbilane synthase